MASCQAKRLKQALKEIGATRSYDNRPPSVRTECKCVGKVSGKRIYEYGAAVATTKLLSKEQEKDLKEKLKNHVVVSHYPDYGFSFVSY